MKNNFFSYSFIVCSKGDYVMHRFTLIFYLAEFQCNMRQWACLKGIWHLWVFGTARWRMPSGITCENLLLESWAIYQYKILKGVIYPLNFDGWSPLLRGTTINDLGGRRKSRKNKFWRPFSRKEEFLKCSHWQENNFFVKIPFLT